MPQVLDHGFVELDDCMATDLSVVNSARVSFGKRKEKIEEGDIKLIGFLMKNRHGTPFEHNSFRFHIKAPIFVVREWQRHRIGSFNEYSLRYSDPIEEFYIPKKEDIRRQTGKPGHYTFEPIGDDELSSDGKKYAIEKRQFIIQCIDLAYTGAMAMYEQMMKAGVAKELARIVLPVGIYTEFYWTVNARSLMNFISLRAAETAQFEIREYAKVVEKFFEQYMPYTYQSFIENGRVAP